MKLTARRRHSLAIHEAGHAVVSIIKGRRPGRVTIRPKGDSLGHMAPHRARFGEVYRPSLTVVAKKMAIAYAGVAAERRAGYHPQRYGWDHDRKLALFLADDFVGGDDVSRKHLVAFAKRQAEFIVDLHWEAIEAVAAALLERETIAGDEVRPIVFPNLRPIPTA